MLLQIALFNYFNIFQNSRKMGVGIQSITMYEVNECAHTYSCVFPTPR